ncbi:hypothetical protein SGCOL_004569 [Colletotrichum sp. CLE4]
MAPQPRMQIPGYYYDEEKGKYFKIEKGGSAPQTAAWSADNVKRRKLQHREAEAVAARRERLKRHIVRSAALRAPLIGGILDVELGVRREERARLRVDGAFGVEDVPAAAWARGLVDKGEVPFVPSFARQSFPNIPCFYVGGDDEKTGLGVAYATLDEETLIGSPRVANNLRHISFNTGRREGVVNQTTPAPSSSSSLTCIIGTSYGLLKLTSDERIHWLGPPRPRPGPAEGDFFDQTFLPSNPNVLLAGGRNRNVRLIDMRVKWSEWDNIPVGPSAHLRAVNPHQFLAAGPRSKMALFDLRYRKRAPNGTKPVVEFAGFRNQAHMHFGWDVDVDSGVVAAAHDDGRLGLYSMQSGRRLRCPALDVVKARTPVKSCQFQRMPGRRHASFFAGVGPNLKMFSVGALGVDDEC